MKRKEYARARQDGYRKGYDGRPPYTGTRNSSDWLATAAYQYGWEEGKAELDRIVNLAVDRMSAGS